MADASPALACAHAPLAWPRISRWINLYSWAQVAFLASLLGIVHLYALAGAGWSSCHVGDGGATSGVCVAFFHLYGLPVVLLAAWHAWLGFTRATEARLPYYTIVTLFQVLVLFIFLTFESRTLLDGLARHVPYLEGALVFGGCCGIVADMALGAYVVFAKLVPACLADPIWTRRAGSQLE